MKELRITLYDSGGRAAVLNHMPDGWDEAMIVTERSRKYHGIFRSFTIPLKFIKDGALILRREFYRNGLASSCRITVEKLDKTTMVYYTAFSGRLDFMTYKDHDFSVEVTAVDGSLSQIVKSRDGDEIAFKWDDFEPSLSVNTKLDHTINPDGYAIKCVSLYQAFGAIVDKITEGGIADGTYAVKSDYLATSGGGLWNKYYLTTVSSLKYVGTATEFDFKTTLADFFKTIDALFCIGMGIETISGKETLRIEKRDYFYSNGAPSMIANVGESKNLSCGVITEWIYNKIKAGYAGQSYSDEAGTGNVPANSLEPNTETFYKTPITVGGEYDIVSKYRADYQGIKRIFNSEAEDTKDTEPVLLRLKIDDWGVGDFHWMLINGRLRKNGSPDIVATPGNMDITPRRMLSAHQFWLNGCCFGFDGSNIGFLSGLNDQANNQTAVSPTGAFQNEYEPLPIRDGFTWFVPVEFNLEAAYPPDFGNLIAANPYGVIAFRYRGYDYTGYVLKMETKLSGAGSVKYSLLSTDTNNLQNLIR